MVKDKDTSFTRCYFLSYYSYIKAVDYTIATAYIRTD